MEKNHKAKSMRAQQTGDKPGLLPALLKLGVVTVETAGCTFL